MAEAPLAVPSRNRVPRIAKNATGSNSLPGSGLTAASTVGSASGAKVFATIAQVESRVRWSEAMIASSARSQPGVAKGCKVRIVTASLAPGAECDQR